MKLGLKLLVVVSVLAVPVAFLADRWAKDVRLEYTRLLDAVSILDVDGFTGETASFFRQAQVVVTEQLTGAYKFPINDAVVELEWRASDSVAGLRVTQALTPSAAPASVMRNLNPDYSIVVGTIRMGFGHHRIAYAMSSWGLTSPRDIYFHDLLSIDSAESALIHETDAMYRKSSKLATEYGGPFEMFHGLLTSSGDATSLRSTALIGARLAPLMRGIPKKTPVIATHTLVALAAAVAGCENIINLVIDNHPQWFVVAPLALNLVQGPRNYIGLSKMLGGVKQLAIAGHWVPEDVVSNIEADCALRASRLASGAPRTILIPVGGAGAQRTFITQLITSLKTHVEENKVRLVVNAADHVELQTALLASMEAMGTVHKVTDIAGAHKLAKDLRDDPAKVPLLNILAFDDYFPAVAATDILVRSVDILAVKPSELAFYPVPKLMIRRVGDHEAWSANRANELGDGTAELRTVEDTMAYIDLFTEIEPISSMNAAIVTNKAVGYYDGCKTALKIAVK